MPGTSSLAHAAATVSRERLTRHLTRVLSSSITDMISTGEVCPELNQLGFNIDKVSTGCGLVWKTWKCQGI